MGVLFPPVFFLIFDARRHTLLLGRALRLEHPTEEPVSNGGPNSREVLCSDWKSVRRKLPIRKGVRWDQEFAFTAFFNRPEL